MTSKRNGFTLIELLVVVAMIAMIIAALATSYKNAQQRARIEKARSEVKIISQAILAYENYSSNHRLPNLSDAPAEASTIGFLIGEGQAESGGRLPALWQGALRGGRRITDPWGMPYHITIEDKDFSVASKIAAGSMTTGFFLPNFYRLTEEERK